MKGSVLAVLMLAMGFTGNANANDQWVASRQKTTTFKCVSPVDVVKGVACYTVDVGKKVLSGAGEIISAPFKSKIFIPKARTYKWERGHWVPPRFYEVPPAPPALFVPPAPPVPPQTESNMRYLPFPVPVGNFVT